MAARGLRRRELLQLLCGGCIAAALPARPATGQEGHLPKYCAIDRDIDLLRYRARSSTGDARLDRALIAELRSALRVLQVNPGFRIIDDVEGANAFAIDRTVIPNTRGTVLFGINLLNDELMTANGGYAVAGIAAHECGHVLQFFSDYGRVLTSGQQTGRAMELHADFLAGYYLGFQKPNDTWLRSFEQSLREKGDWNFNHPLHHGTPDERVHAMTQGYRLGLAKASLRSAADRGVEHVFG